MSERKIVAPGPGWQMPGAAKSKSRRDSTTHILNSLGDQVRSLSKHDIGTPGLSGQNGFKQPHESASPGFMWVLLTSNLPAGSYDTPSSAFGWLLLPDNSISENSLKESPQQIQVWNYSQNSIAASGDWIMVTPFNGIYVAMSAGSGNLGDMIDFEVLEWFSNADPDNPICDCVLAVVTLVQCGSSVQVGDEVLICDPSLCWFNLPVEILVGTRGYATLMARNGLLDTLDCPALLVTFDIGECIWVVRGLCCTESAGYLG